MKNIATVVDWIERGFLVLLFALLVALTSIQIVLRNFFDSGMVWADDAIKVLVLWIAMSGALYATRGANHISIDVASRFLPQGISGLVKRLLFVVAAVICGMASWYSYQFILLEFEDPIIAFLNVPTWLTQAIIPMTLLLMAIRFLSLIIWFPKQTNTSHLDTHTSDSNKGQPS